MKLLREITISDLEDHPIWEHKGESDDVSTISPAADFDSPETHGYIAKTQFQTANGKTYLGYCSPQDTSGLDYVQPVILAGSNQIRLWDEDAGAVANPDVVAKGLGLEVAEVFPLRCSCLVSFEGKQWVEVVDVAT